LRRTVELFIMRYNSLKKHQRAWKGEDVLRTGSNCEYWVQGSERLSSADNKALGEVDRGVEASRTPPPSTELPEYPSIGSERGNKKG